jgi:hypothetical protein
MTGGLHASSRTRVAPVFDLLQSRSDDWVRQLLMLNQGVQAAPVDLAGLNLKFQKGYWGKSEHSLGPPVALLSWLIRNPTPELLAEDAPPERALLAKGDPNIVSKALHALRSSAAPKGWHLLEGPTVPDVLIETPDALIVIDGKRTEAGPTPDAPLPGGRPPIWRHIDAAWEIRGRRRVFGFCIVPGCEPDGGLPPLLLDALHHTVSGAVLGASFPHRSLVERDAIVACMLGGTTWNAVCKAFGISMAPLPRTTPDR